MTGLAACHPAEPLEGVGRATETPRLGRTVALDAAGAPDDVALPSPVPPDFATRFARVGPDSFVAFGHAGGRYAGTVYVTSDAKESVLHQGADVPLGTVLVMVSVDRASHKPGPTFFMQKDAPQGSLAGSWRFGVVETPRATHEERALCARCHAEAPNDHVFALPE